MEVVNEMIKLEPINLIPKEIYSEVIKDKSKSNQVEMKLLESTVLSRFDEYENNKLELSNIGESPILNTSHRKVLKGCYTRNNKYYIGRLTATIIATQSAHVRANCPYCGLSVPDTIDHYLPKTEFPEYSILPINMIPSCSTCNRIKNEEWVENGVRSCINFYYDSFIKYKYLHTIISFKDGNTNFPTITCKLVQPLELVNDEFNIVKSHYKKLKLLKKYETSCESEVSNIYQEISDAKEVDLGQHKKALERRKVALEKNLGINHWRTSLYQALAASNEFLELCLK